MSARIRICLMAILLALPLSPVGAVADDAVFSVREIAVDVTAANASLAREQAVIQAQRQGLERLFARLTLIQDGARPPALEPTQMESLVAGLEVIEEQTSPVRYVGRLAVHFRPAAVRALLHQNGVRFAEIMSKPLLVLPVEYGPDGPILWQRDTAWRTAWQTLPADDGLLTLAVPVGDAADIAAIDAQRAIAADLSAIQAMAQNYGAGQAVVVEYGTYADLARAGLDGIAETAADPSTPPHPPPHPDDPAVRVRFVAWPADTHVSADRYVIRIPVGTALGDIPPTHRLAAMLASRFQERWKQANLLETAALATIQVQVPIRDLADWTDLRRRLDLIPTIVGQRLLVLQRQQASLELSYLGGLPQLQSALAQKDLELIPASLPPAAPPDSLRLTRRQAGIGAPS